MPGWFKDWWNRTMVMDMTQQCNDGSWESGFPQMDDAGIRSVCTDQPTAEIVVLNAPKSKIMREYAEKHGIPIVDMPLSLANREHELTMIQSNMDSWTERRLDDIWEEDNRK